ncbi:hypothetical protein FH972_026132 [Carpinus fangiana]|uniref:BCAS3 domain-containing protein n=1 Tax=Carpinus fangiana TaxID=176857 RepID=A0A5N6L345_9ROSI|nr:hypothetical protein FH972_026132 [Carpinus fangiana]
MPSSSPKVSDLVPSSQDSQSRQQRRGLKAKKPRPASPPPAPAPEEPTAATHEALEQIYPREDEYEAEPAIYPRQMQDQPHHFAILHMLTPCRAKSPPFAFATLNSRGNTHAPPYISPDLLAQHSPPGSLPRHYNDVSSAFSTSIPRQSPYSLSGSPPILAQQFVDGWPLGAAPVGSPPSVLHSRSPPYATSPPNLPQRSATSRRQSTRDVSGDFRHSHLAAQLHNPPLPHQAQPHYFGLPDVNVVPGLQGKSGIKPGERGYYCGFDKFHPRGAHSAINVVLVGSEGALDVYRSERAELNRVGHLDGLRGAVVGAKLLTWPSRNDPFAAVRPLIALTIHGPVLESTADATDLGDDSDGITSPKSGPLQPEPEFVDYQTSVEVYSLSTRTHLTTVYKSESVRTFELPLGPHFVPPSPVGDLKVDASSRFLTVASGSSGEIFVFSPLESKLSGRKTPVSFSCIGKYWTSIERYSLRERPATGGSEEYASPSTLENKSPVYSLSGRWLAIVPPTAHSPGAINGTPILAPGSDKPPGLNTFTAPGPPPIDCIIDSPDQASMLNRMARAATQEMLKGAQWVGTQGMQAWRNYWAKPGQADEAIGQPGPSDNWGPTAHGDPGDHQDERNRPALVSIIDLNRLSGAYHGVKSLEPMATFEAPEGCSCVSLSPSGLHLLSVSHRGDIQRVWDLMRLRPTRTGDLESSRAGKVAKPLVRQVAKFQRLTNAHVVDVVWSDPKGDKLAIITHRGTVHLFEMPLLAFQWPPRVPVSRPAPTTAKRPGSNSQAADVGFLPSTISTINDTVRKQASGLSALTSNLNITQGRGRKAVASGVSKSIGAAAEGLGQLRHLGDNKLRLGPSSIAVVSPGCVRFLTGSARGYVGVLSGGALRSHAMPRLDRTKSPGKYAASKDLEFSLPVITDERVAPAAQRFVLGNTDSTPQIPVSGFWNLETHKAEDETDTPPPPLSFAEIETTNPFQPFHTDRRVTLSTYIDDNDAFGRGKWTFGSDITTATIQVGGKAPGLAAHYEGNTQDDDLLSAEQLALGVDEDGFEVLDAPILDDGREQHLI